MKRFLIIAGFASLVFAFGCNKPKEDCEEDKLTAAFVLDYPDTVAVGAAFNLDIGYVVENSCGDFGSFEAERYDNTLEVKLKTKYTGCSCIDEFVEKEVSYPVIFEEAATYELKFWVAENEYQTYIVVAQ